MTFYRYQPFVINNKLHGLLAMNETRNLRRRFFFYGQANGRGHALLSDNPMA